MRLQKEDRPMETYHFADHVGITMSFLPPMTGNGEHTNYRTGDDWGIVYDIVNCYTHKKHPSSKDIPKAMHPLQIRRS